MARLTLYGMYQYDNTLFDDLTLPDGLDSENLINEIFDLSGDLYPYYQIPSRLKRSINFWFTRNYENFERMLAALEAEYNPIENYDKTLNSTRTPGLTTTATNSGKDTSENSGDDTLTHTYNRTDTDTLSGSDREINGGTDSIERKVSAYDQTAYDPESYDVTTKDLNSSTVYGKIDTLSMTGTLTDKNVLNDKNTFTHGKKVTTTEAGKEDYAERIHGNIGVTTNQDMINQEIELRKFDLYQDIAERFERKFLVQVY